MNTRLFCGAIAITSLVLMGADSPPRPSVRAREGKVVAIAEIRQGRNGLLVMSDKKETKRQLLRVLAQARIWLNRNSVTLGELKRGDLVTVATDEYDFVTEIAAKRKHEPDVNGQSFPAAMSLKSGR